MAREIQILRWCDACAAREVKTQAQHTWTVGIRSGDANGSPSVKVLDLCAEDSDALVAPVAALLDSVGQLPEPRQAPKPAGRAPVPERSRCLICGLTYTADNSVTSHIYKDHLGKRRRPVPPLRCPLCPHVASTTAGARRHAVTDHQISALNAAYDAASAAGVQVGM